jgi:hypothetical protein
MRFWAALKSKSLGLGNGLELLPYEEWMVPDRSLEECMLPKDLIAPMQNARLCAREILDDPGIQDFKGMVKAVLASSAMLLSLDRSFKLELEFLQQNGEAAMEKAVEKNILAALPSATKATTLSQSMQSLQDIKVSQLGRFCSHASKAQVTCVLELVANMTKGVAPDGKFATASTFYTNVWEQLPYFMRRGVVVTEAGKTVKKLLVGKAALMVGFTEVQARMAKKDAVKLHELEIYQSFKFLLGPGEVQELSGWIKACLSDMASERSTATGSAASSSGLQKKTKSQKEAASSVMSFFG